MEDCGHRKRMKRSQNDFVAPTLNPHRGNIAFRVFSLFCWCDGKTVSLQLPLSAGTAVLTRAIRLGVDLVARPSGFVCVIECERKNNVVAAVVAAVPAAHDVLVAKGRTRCKRTEGGADGEERDMECAHDTSNETKLSRG